METLVIDAYEGQYVAIFNVPGTYWNRDIPDKKYVGIKLQGKYENITCDVNPDHIPNIWYKNGNKVLYLSILKALYECIEWAILWYNLYANTLKELGFLINP